MQHLWVKDNRDAAQTRQLLQCYDRLSSLNLSNSSCLQTTVPGLTAFTNIQDLRVCIDSSLALNALTLLPHLLELSIHCNYSWGTEPIHFQLEKLTDLRLFRLHGARSVLGSPITNPKLLTSELSQFTDKVLDRLHMAEQAVCLESSYRRQFGLSGQLGEPAVPCWRDRPRQSHSGFPNRLLFAIHCLDNPMVGGPAR